MPLPALQDNVPPRLATAQTWLYRAALVLLFAWFTAMALNGLGNVWQWGHNGYNGAAFTQAARNSLRFHIFGQALLVVGVRTGLAQDPDEGWRRWRPTLVFLAIFSAVVLLDAAGFFLWIKSLRDGLTEMGSAFAGRSSSPDAYFDRLWKRSLDLQVPLLLGLLAAWLPLELWRVVTRRANFYDFVAIAFFLAQTIHFLVFKQAVTATLQAGGAGGSAADWHCGLGQARALNVPEVHKSRLVGGPGGDLFERRCPPDSVMWGLRSHVGMVLDNVGIAGAVLTPAFLAGKEIASPKVRFAPAASVLPAPATPAVPVRIL